MTRAFRSSARKNSREPARFRATVDSNGRTIWVADAHRGNGNRFVVHADELLTAFVELESAIRDKEEEYALHKGELGPVLPPPPGP
jgi:hypothetical protein